ncbi:CBS domain-containing protein [Fontimonas sp. SYSU GA230001]|uniref:CBS domain-containing protein n=1 Tax=Fontimonas sp. SYSU GA230001 TaxID=3142450 RepID=UPI0032B5F6B8
MPYHAVPLASITMPARLPRRIVVDGLHLTDDDSARAVMTDFAHVQPVGVARDRHIDDALQDMIQAGVRSLLVIAEGVVIGLITSYDIQGEKPIQFLQGTDCIHESCLHRDVLVDDIMVRWEALPKLSLDALGRQRVGDLRLTFAQHPEWMHLLVIETQDDGACFVRGIVSRTRLERLTDLQKVAA